MRSYPKQIIEKNVKISHSGFLPRHFQFIIVIRLMQLTRRNSPKPPALTSNSSPSTYKLGHPIVFWQSHFVLFRLFTLQKANYY